MPRQPRAFSELGSVVHCQGQHRAQIHFGSDGYIRGPRRGADKKRALEDLLAIRAAAADHTTRMGALQAMRREADRLKEEAETEIGGVEAVQGGYRARVRNTEGVGAQN